MSEILPDEPNLDALAKEIKKEAYDNSPEDVYLFAPHNRRGEPYINGLVGNHPLIGAVRYVRDDLARGWLPIDTAPKDGTDILLWSKQFQEQWVACWDNMIEGDEWDVYRWLDCEGNARHADVPTHWMPLPPPPPESAVKPEENDQEDE